jgi:hypothetical protein
MAEIRNYTMNLSDRRCAAGAASLNPLRGLAVAEVHRVTLSTGYR